MKPTSIHLLKTGLKLWWLILAGSGLNPPVWAASLQPVIVAPADASPLERLAAREVRRYVYLRTGHLPPLRLAAEGLPGEGAAIVVARKDRAIVNALGGDPAFAGSLAVLEAQGCVLKTLERNGRRMVLIVGGDDVGTLYGAYRFAEHLGVRFYLHGDVVPDQPLTASVRGFDESKGAAQLQRASIPRSPAWLPVLDEERRPLFALRGIQPFHDFPEGPDWWNRDDYLAIIAQLPKLGMNFIGLHTYPEGRPNAEPTVWIGLPADVNADGSVKFSYPASYQNTLRGNWGYRARKTSEFAFGAAELFERDDYGADVMREACPEPATPEGCNAVFERTGAMLRAAFGFAHQLGVKTCVGTETPLVVPKLVAERLKTAGQDPADPAVIEQLYEGMFRRAALAYPLDYFWFWTPEGWTWEGVKESQVAATTHDLAAGIAAAKKISAPFQLATCGWVLGPQQDRALFDKILPKAVAVSCINREVGRTPVDKGFAEVSGRSKWAIPWLEDDPGLTSPQFWVGRMRRDAADARRYGCDGLLGIHWRTRALGPNVSGLAQAAWDQSPWNQPSIQPPEPPKLAGPVGGQWADFPTHAIAGAADAPVYQSVRYNLSAYHLPVSNGVCRVTLKFCEPHYTAAGLRVFDVKLQGRAVIERLDIFAKAGQNRALDYTFPGVLVTNGWLEVEFVPRVEYPSIAGIVVEGTGFTQKINCGGAAWGDFAADWPSGTPSKQWSPPTDDFYLDWTRHQFGAEVAPAAARIFQELDGVFPRPCDWVNGPGGIKPDGRRWTQVAAEYEFVDALAALRPAVRGAGGRERFEYWLETFRYARSAAELNCAWADYNQALATVKAEKDPAAQREQARAQLLPKRCELVRLAGDVFQHLLATVTTTGELGTVANWEQHLLPEVFDQPGTELARLLGASLPADAQLPRTYRGPTRIIVPTVRTCTAPGEPLDLKVIVLAEQPPREASLFSRRMGEGRFSKTRLLPVARGVHSVTIPAFGGGESDLEYYVKVVPATGAAVYFPATAPALNQTVVVAQR